jgi:hypothetical protein
MSAELMGTFRPHVDEEIGLDDGVTALTSSSYQTRSVIEYAAAFYRHLGKINRARAVEAAQAQKADQEKPRRGGRAATFWTPLLHPMRVDLKARVGVRPIRSRGTVGRRGLLQKRGL